MRRSALRAARRSRLCGTASLTGTQGREAVAAYRDLLDAVRVHAQYLNPLEGRGKAPADVSPSDLVTSSEAQLFARSMAIVAARARRSFPAGDRESLPEAALLWRQAATSLRASQDLLGHASDP